MCGSPPGTRCATDTRAAATTTLVRYDTAHPAGPDVGPLGSATASYDYQRVCANTRISVLNPDDPDGMPLEDSAPASDVANWLEPGRYAATDVETGEKYELRISTEPTPVALADVKVGQRIVHPTTGAVYNATRVRHDVPTRGFTQVDFVDDDGNPGHYVHRDDQQVPVTFVAPMGPAGRPQTYPTLSPGSKFVEGRSHADTARALRAEIAEAAKSGQLPAGFTYSVRKGTEPGTYEVTADSEDPYAYTEGATDEDRAAFGVERTMRPEVAALGEHLRAVVGQYNRPGTGLALVYGHQGRSL